MRRFNTTVVAAKQEYCILCVCVCRLRYPTCNAHAPYCHLCPVGLYNIIPRYLITGTKMCV